MYSRQIEQDLKRQIKKGKSVLLLGPRQVGKTTLCHRFKFDLEINLASIKERLLFERDPERLEKIASASSKKIFIFIDEIQKVPQLFDSIQVLIDRNKAQFLLTGSSARKIKQQVDFNFAPGRLVNLRLDPLNLREVPIDIESVLSFGQLPAVLTEADPEQRELELRSYVETYIEEEIRKETRIRSIALFARFIELAALQSGFVSNFTEISKEIGPTVVTIQSYFQLLEDTLFVDRVDPYTKGSSRKKLTKSSRYLFFDMGVRRILAEEPKKASQDRKGHLFEHLIGNEIMRWTRTSGRGAKLYFWRDPDGPEIDWLVDYEGQLLPIEVKLGSEPGKKSVRHIRTFFDEYPSAKSGVVVSTSDIKYSLDKRIRVIPYQDLHSILDLWIQEI